MNGDNQTRIYPSWWIPFLEELQASLKVIDAEITLLEETYRAEAEAFQTSTNDHNSTSGIRD